MKITFGIGNRIKGDNRYTLLRFYSGNWTYGEGWKFSVSLHKKLFYYLKGYRNLYLTIFWINFHWVGR